ncbi:hypothetical protein AVEN_80774-1 [Araneus ventricosus]|uniref:Uncharacterized protein n=1 Tax=Araneus ventricosus TaxID=182803 RepID=A0A4Y2I3A6_ARAVE|nr:hypothetical protein AVEN_80774-1 [Araneus ventricosus]
MPLGLPTIFSSQTCVINAKVLILERENIMIRAQLEEKHAIMETHVRKILLQFKRLIGELVSRISGEIRENIVYEVTNSQSTHGSGSNIIDNDRVLIVKPKEVDNEKFPENKEIITSVIERGNNTTRVRGITKINGSGIKIAMVGGG